MVCRISGKRFFVSRRWKPDEPMDVRWMRPERNLFLFWPAFSPPIQPPPSTHPGRPEFPILNTPYDYEEISWELKKTVEHLTGEA